MLLAQLQTVEPEHLKDFALILLACITAGSLLWGMIRGGKPQRMSIETQPVEVRESPTYLTRSEADKAHSSFTMRLAAAELQIQTVRQESVESFAKLAREMGDMERRINFADEGRTKEIHDRLNDILGDLREMRGEVKAKFNT